MDGASTAAVIGAFAGAVAGGFFGWLATRASEKRAAKRDDQLRRIEQTRQSFHVQQRWMLEQRIAGWPPGIPPDTVTKSAYPVADLRLVANQDVLDDVAMFTVLVLSVRGEPGPVQADEMRRFMLLGQQVNAALDKQADRARDYRPLLPFGSWDAALERAVAWIEAHPDGRVRPEFRKVM